MISTAMKIPNWCIACLPPLRISDASIPQPPLFWLVPLLLGVNNGRTDGGAGGIDYAILPAGGNAIEFYDEQGKLLKTVAVEGDRGAAA